MTDDSVNDSLFRTLRRSILPFMLQIEEELSLIVGREMLPSFKEKLAVSVNDYCDGKGMCRQNIVIILTPLYRI